MKWMFLLAMLGCGGAVEAADGAATTEWRCRLITSPGMSMPCDFTKDAGEKVTCDCPSSCSYYDLFSVKNGTCVTE